ncbi:FAD-binding oxidoreductase [Leptolyngbya sp. FACHB-541]|uniref:NAD(P)/FAD-dependent oxidoreductase n=1 Tax=Leptolyngbya sp. FACHB-541 TaxID=2692810 RepID=UPI0016874136|nr:FAD-dependent oxidoreductase [Leptolyngbya sp. FACHB-541]MBD1999308.1 FAD-binding oxidoreductase [Leptolyngbya sp. FACHB-541]
MENLQPLSDSFWLTDSVNRHPQSTLQLPTASEAVVIGGGISGVSVAYWLSQLGVETVLLEGRGLAEGATGRNGGHLAPGTNKDFADAIATHGLKETLAIWHFTQHVVELVHQFIDQHQVDCDLHFNSLASLALTPLEVEQQRRSFELMREAGFDVQLWDKELAMHHTQSSRFLGGFLYKEHAQVWAAKLVVAIARAAMQNGANILTGTQVEAVEQSRNGLIVHTPRGEIRAKFVVHATNAYARHLRPVLRDLIVPVRGQVIVTAPVPPLWNFDWITNHGYEYCLQRPDGRIVLGGMRWRSPSHEWNIEDDSQVEPSVSAGLRAFLPDHFEALRNVQVQGEWTGIMGFSPDDNPLVGELPGYPAEYIIAGYTGHGMPIAFGAGRAIAQMITGQKPELPLSFSPAR